MKRLYLVRHGETEWNADNRIQGSMDIPLSEKGREQAGWLARYLRNRISPEMTFSSNLSRANETAKIITKELDLPEPVVSPLLREINCGSREGLPVERLEKDYPEEFELWRLNADCRCPEGESVIDVGSRIEKFFKEWEKDLSKVETALIVAHGLFNRAFLARVMKPGLQECRYFEQDNAALNTFVWGRIMPKVAMWNFTPGC